MKKGKYIIIALFMAGIISFSLIGEKKINGVNFVAPINHIPEEAVLKPKKILHTNWVAFVPYAIAFKGETAIHYNEKWQWWGETVEGIRTCVKYTHKNNQKVMLKPHIWVKGEGWAGDFELNNEKEWKKWETAYEKYILTFVKVAQETNVELFCIGTEIRKVAEKRPQFWRQLIKKIRANYDGQLTYAANWDNYEKVKFWDDLDFIGVDSYFPLIHQDNPSLSNIIDAWKKHKHRLQQFSEKYNKKYRGVKLFTYICTD